MNDNLELTKRQRIKEILRGNDFVTIDQAVDVLLANGFWDGKEVSEIIRTFYKADARKFLKTAKDENGRPAFANIEIVNEEGEAVHAYMQPCLFDIEQYKQVITYHSMKAKYHANEAREFKRELLQKFNVQVELPFELPE